MSETVEGRTIAEGVAEGEVLVSPEPISFYGAVDTDTGEFIEADHHLTGETIAGKVLVFPKGKGSTVGSYVIYGLAQEGTGPAAIINHETETIVATGPSSARFPVWTESRTPWSGSRTATGFVSTRPRGRSRCSPMTERETVVVGLSGASGTRLGVETVEALAEHFSVHAVVTEGARAVMDHETDTRTETMATLESMATVHDGEDLSAPIASGSVPTAGMVVVPASMKSVAAIANSYAENLLVRAADVTLKEDRKLVVVPRESPLNEAHLENLLTLRKRGVAVVPPVLGFYYDPQNIQDVIDRTVGTILDRFDVEHDRYEPWDPA
ncbi:MAG: UbiX family flavin prenyltransferase [Halobacteriota archaeon]